jgi:hypothetical protein
MMEIEEAVMDLANTIGREVLTLCLASFDALGLPIMVGGIKFYTVVNSYKFTRPLVALFLSKVMLINHLWAKELLSP